MFDYSAIIVGVLSLIGTIAGSYMANSKTTALMQMEMDHIKSDIKELDEKVHKHNNLVERMVIVEQSTKSAHKRLDDMNEMHIKNHL